MICKLLTTVYRNYFHFPQRQKKKIFPFMTGLRFKIFKQKILVFLLSQTANGKTILSDFLNKIGTKMDRLFKQKVVIIDIWAWQQQWMPEEAKI